MQRHPNHMLDLAPFSRWTLRDKAAQRPVSLNVGLFNRRNAMDEAENELPDILPFCDATGRAVCYLYDGSYFYLYGGKPVACLHDNEHVYSFDGRWLG